MVVFFKKYTERMERALGEMQELIRGMERTYPEEVPLAEIQASLPARAEVVAVEAVEEGRVAAFLVQIEEEAPLARSASPRHDRPTSDSCILIQREIGEEKATWGRSEATPPPSRCSGGTR